MQSDVSHPVGQLAAKQCEWDKPHIDADLARLMASLPDGHHHARLVTVSVPTVATGRMRRGAHIILRSLFGRRRRQSRRRSTPRCQTLRAPPVSMRRQSQPRRHARSRLQTQCRQNDPTSCTQRPRLACTRPCQHTAVKESAGLVRSDGKRPDGLTQILWQA
jgi:hypothetical protein